MSEIRRIRAVTSHQQVPERLMDATGLPATREEILGDNEPLQSFEAFIWKVEQVKEVDQDEAVYAADTTARFDGIDAVYGKPSRNQDEQLKSEKNVPDYVFERYSKESSVCWDVVFGFKMPDGSIRACQTFIRTSVPALSKSEIEEYYSSESSAAGLLLIKFLRDRYSKHIFQIVDEQHKQIAEISGDLAWQMIVNKVPPTRLLKKLLFNEAEEITTDGERTIGLYTISLIELLQESKNNAIEVTLKDGTKGFVSWTNPEDFVEVSSMLTQNFDNSPSYKSLTEDAKAGYKAANSVEAISKDIFKDDVLAAYIMKNELHELIGYILVRNGQSRGYKGEPSAVIKRIHARLGHVEQGIGKTLIQLAERAAKAYGLSVIGVGASGESATFFAKNGYASVENGKNPVFSQRGIDANWNYLEKKLR